MFSLIVNTVLLLVLILFVPSSNAAQSPASSAPSADKQRQLNIAVKPWTGDFDQMVSRRMIRVLVPYSRSLYFNDKGHERGISAETVRDFERYINKKHKTQKRPITVYMIPTTRDKLISGVAAGMRDISAGNLTVTEDRLKLVDFAAPEDQKPNIEIVLTGPKSPLISSVDDLAGKTVHVRKASSYFDSLNELNHRFRKEGKPEAKLVLVSDALEDEDMMEMLNAGLLELIVVDDWKALMWAQILTKIKPRPDIVLREGGRVGWAIRKESPRLQEAIYDFYRNFVKKQGVAEYRLKKYMTRVKQIKDSSATEDYKRFNETLALFEKYGEKDGFDPLMLAAQGYQESQLDQKARSHVGAIGIMQVMPQTGAELKVGDIQIAENNVHAGAKYMDQLMEKYFRDANFSEGNRPLFAFASYNAGPGNMSKMRKETKKRGLDPDKWFNNVEIVTAEKIGAETTTYVRNIYKYYVAYKLTLEAQEVARKAREGVAPGNK
ncbi:MAG: lytic transglycosylase F [Desulfobacteraceae bacterium]|nr:MAG: lytic transglycosylase F [Desulfobacteraceae bacterium]